MLSQKTNTAHLYTSRNRYDFNTDEILQDDEEQTLYFPVEVDSEYYHPTIHPWETPQQMGSLCINITAQCRAINESVGVIFSHPDITAIARHPVFNSGFVVVDYLQHLGYNATLRRCEQMPLELPTIEFDLIAFFAVAELARVFTGEFLNDVLYLAANRDKTQGITQEKRLRCWTRLPNGIMKDYVKLPWVLSLGGVEYAVRLAVIDTAAVHGNASYKTFCANSGVVLEAKELFTKEEKSKMLEMYVNRPHEFDAYALGDLYNYPALEGNAAMFNTIYSTLGLGHLTKPPALTTGSTVKTLLEATIANLFGVDEPKTVIEKYCIKTSAVTLKNIHKRTGALNAKVDGGRCRNNKPTNTRGKGVLADIDIAGCYGEGLRNQLYPFGTPMLLDYETNSAGTAAMDTLKEFLKQYRHELVPGLWQARVSSVERLKYPCDFLVSWLPPKDISKMNSDSETASSENWWEVENAGETKIFSHEVKNAVINHDFIQWLENIASPRQRKELLTKLVVVTAIYYPASERVDSTSDLEEKQQNHNGKNRSQARRINGKLTRINTDQDCHAWFAVDLGKLLVSKLLRERKAHAKGTALNELFKLVINTIYGDMVSPYFTVGNVVVGNNITARARALAWYMEKGLHGWQSITDGCVFDVNRVLYGSVNGENVVGLYDKNPCTLQMSFKPLGGYDTVELAWEGETPTLRLYKDEAVETPVNALKWLDSAAMAHLQAIFPGVDVLHQPTKDVWGNERVGQFNFETKALYVRGAFHGTANYLLDPGNGSEPKLAMRSYQKKEHQQYSMNDDGELTDAGTANPAMVFMQQLLKDPNAIERGAVYLKENILKVGDYAQHYSNKYQYSRLYPGVTVRSAARLNEFSLSQFTYQTIEQYESWLKELQRLKRKYGQGFEMYFTNDDGVLKYQEMVETIDKAVNAGEMKLAVKGSTSRHTHRYKEEHPNETVLTTAKTTFNRLQGLSGIDE